MAGNADHGSDIQPVEVADWQGRGHGLRVKRYVAPQKKKGADAFVSVINFTFSKT